MPEPLENSAEIPADLPITAGNSIKTTRKTSSAPSREKFIERALEELESPLVAYATTLLNDTDLARDVVQDSFTRLCQQDIVKVEPNLRSWLFAACRVRALDTLRKDKRRSEPPEEVRWKKFSGSGIQQNEQTDHLEKQQRLMGYLDRLSANQREVILLKHQQGLSYQEIHKVTGLSTGNIGFLIHTGLKRLRDILPDDMRA
jgi:RNA polymerase sigma factor (sigma-70 family)